MKLDTYQIAALEESIFLISSKAMEFEQRGARATTREEAAEWRSRACQTWALRDTLRLMLGHK